MANGAVGAARVVAKVVGPARRTVLVGCEHRYPLRVFPLDTPGAAAAGSATVMLSELGGGLLGGDTSVTTVEVGEGATLHVQTQSATRVFRRRAATLMRGTSAVTKVEVQRDGLVVIAPDCIVPFAGSSFDSTLHVHLASPTASVVAAEAVACGRVAAGERWAFDMLALQSRFSCSGFGHEESVGAGDATAKHTTLLKDTLAGTGAQFASAIDFTGADSCAMYNAFANIVAIGPRTAHVIEHAEAVHRQHNKAHVSPRRRGSNDGRRAAMPSLVLSVSRLELAPLPVGTPAAVIRLVASTTEHLYRAMHELLAPLETTVGTAPYRDHVLGGQSEDETVASSAVRGVTNYGGASTKPIAAAGDVLPSSPLVATDLNSTSPAQQPTSTDAGWGDLSVGAMWRLMQLADATLPTGGFAHSGGLESAAQLGFLRTEKALATFLAVTLRHSAQLLVPFVATSHRLYLASANDDAAVMASLKDANGVLDVLLRGSPVAYAASIEQGSSLLRLLTSWAPDANLSALRTGPAHFAIVFGVAAAALGVHTSPHAALAFQYGLARDVLAAAIRMNLIGPTVGVQMLDGVMAYAGVDSGLTDAVEVDRLVDVAAGCNVLGDVLQANHKLLFSRLFRS